MSSGKGRSLNQVQDEVGGVFEYNLYDDCWYENIALRNPTEPLAER